MLRRGDSFTCSCLVFLDEMSLTGKNRWSQDVHVLEDNFVYFCIRFYSYRF